MSDNDKLTPAKKITLEDIPTDETFYDERMIFKARDRWTNMLGTEFNPEDISFKTFKKMKREDSQVNAALRILVLATLAREWDLHYSGKDLPLGANMIQYLKQIFGTVNTTQWKQGGLTQWMEEIIDVSLTYGFSATEMVFHLDQFKDNPVVGLKKLKVAPAKTIENGLDWNEFGDLTKIKQWVDGEENELDLERILMWPYRMEGSNWYGQSDMRQIYPNWYIKNFIQKMWNIAIERYGTPVLVGKVRNKKDLTKMDEVLDKIRTRSNLSIMKNDDVKALEWRMTPDQFERAVRYQNSQIMIGLLVPTLLLSQENVGARALGETHLEIFLLRIKAIQNELIEVISSLIKILIDFNFNNVEVYPELVFRELSSIDKLNLSKMLEILINAEIIEPKETWIRKHLGIPENVNIDGEETPKIKSKPINTEPSNDDTGDSNDIDGEEEIPNTEHEESEKSEIRFTTIHKFQEDADELAKIMDEFEIQMGRPINTYLRMAEDDVLDRLDEIVKNPDELKLLPVTKRQLERTVNAMDDAYEESFNSGKVVLDKLKKEAGKEQSSRKLQDAPSWFGERGVYVYKTLDTSLTGKLQNIIETGLNEGFTVEELQAKVENEFRNSRVSSNGVRAITRTNINMAFNRARLDLYNENSDFVKGVEYSAIIDPSTTPFCNEHDGMILKLDDPRVEDMTPPNHMQCRSLWIGITIVDEPIKFNWQDGKTTPDDGFFASAVNEGVPS